MWIPPWTGCGGWCAQVVIVRNGKTDCISRTAPSNCANDGFSGGTYLTASFDNNCTPLDADADDGAIQFRLYTPVGGAHSDWCVQSVDIYASNGTKTQTYETPTHWVSDNGFDGWVEQGTYAKEHWAHNYEHIYKNAAVLQPWCC